MFKNNVKYMKIICFILCFAIFFSIGSTVRAGIGSAFLNLLVGDIEGTFEELYKTFLQQITQLFVSIGDAAMHLIASAVGETVTIDKLLYNDVERVSIDYWNDTTDTSKEDVAVPIKGFMQPTVEKWYAVFFKIATIVYMIVLVYIGIAILLSSTAEKKAGYKQLLTNWFMGIVILFMFPFVMKYIIIINDAFIQTIKTKAIPEGENEATYTDLLSKKTFIELMLVYGEKEFTNILVGIEDLEYEVQLNDIPDVMTLVRYMAHKNIQEDTGAVEDAKKIGNIVVAIVYLILIGQTIAVLVMYYKRAFMIAFLITIFPFTATLFFRINSLISLREYPV